MSNLLCKRKNCTKQRQKGSDHCVTHQPAPKCRVLGCTRRTTRPDGYCWQHTEFAQSGAKA